MDNSCSSKDLSLEFSFSNSISSGYSVSSDALYNSRLVLTSLICPGVELEKQSGTTFVKESALYIDKPSSYINFQT